MQQHDISKEGRHSRHLPSEDSHNFFPANLVFRIHSRTNQLKPIVGLGRIIQGYQSRAPFLSNPHEAFILDDSAEPCSERSTALKLVPVLKSLPQSALHSIFGVTQVPQYRQGPLYAHIPMTLNEFVEGCNICVPCKRP
jgi:hypothetical protein